MRLFVAVHFDDTVRATIRTALDRFPVERPPWRWSSPETWHVTLKFLGETSNDQLERALAALDVVRTHHPAFDATLGRFGGFPDLRSPRVLFYRMEQGAPALAALARAVDAALEAALGLERETRPLHAHVTVARVKTPLPAPVAAMLASVPALVTPVFRVSTFTLTESHLGRTGAQYSVVKLFALS
jgi:RNA 2',3'-cyclic 3'-phosphodiesterase